MANHSAYTPEIAHAILSALRIGCSERDACAGAGLPWRTWCTWKRDVRKGEDRGEGINELVRLVPQAAAQGRNAIAAKINKLAGKDYRAGAWLLEWHEKRNERRARLKLLEAEIELARLKIQTSSGFASSLANATDEELALVTQVIERARSRGPSASGQSGASAPQSGDDPTDDSR